MRLCLYTKGPYISFKSCEFSFNNPVLVTGGSDEMMWEA